MADERTSAGDTTYTDSLLGTAMARQNGSTQFSTRDESGTLTTMRDGSGNYHYLTDALGSVAAVTKSDGSLAKVTAPDGSTGSRYQYDPYGVTSAVGAAADTAVINPWRYTGQFQDPTGLYKMGARYMQPAKGQWTQPDPSALESNAYLYVRGNPVNLTDPSGLWAGVASAVLQVVGLVDLSNDIAGGNFGVIAASLLFEAVVTATCAAGVIGFHRGYRCGGGPGMSGCWGRRR